MKSVIDIFCELVQIDSPSGQESAIAEYIQHFLHPFGFTFKQDSVGNILAKKSGKGAPVLFCAHMDTVQPGEGVKPNIKEGVIYSGQDTVLGADNKASIAAILAAVSSLPPTADDSVELLFTVKEETGGGVEFFPFKWLAAKQGFIFDHAAPLGQIVSASPFITNFVVGFTGKAAHTKDPEKGISALIVAADFITQFSVSKNVAVNFGQLSGGTGANVIPEESVLLGEARSFSEKDFLQTLGLLQNQAESSAKKFGAKCKWKAEGYCPGYSVPGRSIALAMAQTVLKELGYQPELVASKGVSDANILVAAGVDAVVLSDGVQNPHCLSEHISVNSLQKLEQIVDTIFKYRRAGSKPTP